jgi:hypothetical protein
LKNLASSMRGCRLHGCTMTETRRCGVSETRRFDTQMSNVSSVSMEYCPALDSSLRLLCKKRKDAIRFI